MAGAADGEDGLGEAEATDSRVRDVEGASNLHQALSSRTTCQSFASLVRGQCVLPSELHSSRLGPGAALAGPGKDQATFELSKATKHGEHQPAMWGGGVGPTVREGSKPCTGLRDLIQHVEQVPG
jgi:hypothetical protein